MRCGRSGCPCTTCEECGRDYPCNCEMRKKTDAFLQNVTGYEDQNPKWLQEAIELLEEWRDRG